MRAGKAKNPVSSTTVVVIQASQGTASKDVFVAGLEESDFSASSGLGTTFC